MHDCVKTKELFTELLLDHPDRGPDEMLSADLHQCEACRAEFAAMKATLRVTTRLRDTVAPAESYWTGYHARLRNNLTSTYQTKRPSWLLRLLKSSVPIPAPVAAALVVAGVILIPLVIKASRRPVVEVPSPVVVRVEVPKIQEKIVTQIVYRERRASSRTTTRANNDPGVSDAFARSQEPSTEIPATLTGFKPTDEIKLTVIKGGTPNEK